MKNIETTREEYEYILSLIPYTINVGLLQTALLRWY